MAIKNVSSSQLAELFTALGWQEEYKKTSHRQFTKGKRRFEIPFAKNSGSGDLEIRGMKRYFENAGEARVYSELKVYRGNMNGFIKDVKKANRAKLNNDKT